MEGGGIDRCRCFLDENRERNCIFSGAPPCCTIQDYRNAMEEEGDNQRAHSWREGCSGRKGKARAETDPVFLIQLVREQQPA